jgi:Na+/melibiose symporter-like transporter
MSLNISELGSNHGFTKKIKFAMAQFAPFLISFQLAGTREIYTLNWGADPTVIGAIFLFIAIWNPFNDALIGWMQDREMLAKWFDKFKWGRRAPWYQTHLILCCFVLVFAFLPYNLNLSGSSLHALFFANVFVGYWGFSMLYVSTGAALYELYPFNEERMVMESLIIGTAILGLFIGVFCTLGTLAFPSLSLASGFLGASFALLSLMAVPVMKEAKMPVDNGAVTGYFTELCECYKNKSFQLFCASQFFDGCFNGVRAGFFVAYFFYIPKVIQ